jgi:DNA-binding IscR family transcriptional regulator
MNGGGLAHYTPPLGGVSRTVYHRTVEEIYHVFEGTEGFVECTTDPEYCHRTDGCATQEIWAQMYDACMEILESTTLEDLARRAKEKREDPTGT